MKRKKERTGRRKRNRNDTTGNLDLEVNIRILSGECYRIALKREEALFPAAINDGVFLFELSFLNVQTEYPDMIFVKDVRTCLRNILVQWFAKNNHAIYFICSAKVQSAAARMRLFKKWFREGVKEEKLLIQLAEYKLIDGCDVHYMALLVRDDYPGLEKVLEEIATFIEIQQQEKNQ